MLNTFEQRSATQPITNSGTHKRSKSRKLSRNGNGGDIVKSGRDHISIMSGHATRIDDRPLFSVTKGVKSATHRRRAAHSKMKDSISSLRTGEGMAYLDS